MQRRYRCAVTQGRPWLNLGSGEQNDFQYAREVIAHYGSHTLIV